MWLIATLSSGTDLELGGDARLGGAEGVVPGMTVEAVEGRGTNKMGKGKGWGLESGAYQQHLGFCWRKKRWRGSGQRDGKEERYPTRKTESEFHQSPLFHTNDRVIKMRTVNIVDPTFVLQAGLVTLKVMGWGGWLPSGTWGPGWNSCLFWRIHAGDLTKAIILR